MTINNRQLNYILFSILIIYLIFHILTLALSPLPWFDEVIFANITYKFKETGNLLFDLYPWRHPQDQEVLSYGPIYFLMTKTSWDMLGIGVWQFRIVNFIFAIISLTILYKTSNLFIQQKRWYILAIALVLTDPAYLQNAHSGRMDLVALFFVLASLYCLIKDNQLKPIYIIASGVLAVMAMLTTPRVFYLEIGLAVVLLMKIVQLKKPLIKTIILFAAPIVIFYGIWLLYAFGSITAFVNYYITNPTLAGHFGGNWNVTTFQYPLLATIVLCSLIAVFYVKRLFINPFFVFTLLSLILFYTLIYDYGLYNAMVLPFGMIIVFMVLDQIERIWIRRLLTGVISILFIINLGIFSTKSLVVITTANERSTNQASNIIGNFISPNSKVIGDDRYYYASLQNGITYQSIEEGNIYRNDYDRLIDYQKQNFQFDYIILSRESEMANPKILQLYNQEYRVEKVADIKLDYAPLPILKKIQSIVQRIIGHKVHASMNGSIYKVSLKE